MVVPGDGSIDASARRSQPIRSYHARHGRARPSQLATLESLWPHYGVNFPNDHAEPGLTRARVLNGSTGCVARLFEPRLPVVLDIGFGMGDVTATMAAAEPDVGILAVDVHRPGVVRLLALAQAGSLTNVRVARGDVKVLLERGIPPASIAGARIFFPDPWPKKRHHKRRLIGHEFIGLLVDRVAPAGILHLATDWAEYADEMRTALEEQPGLVRLAVTESQGPPREPDHDRLRPWRPETPYERVGREAGRVVTDLVYRRR